MSPDSSVEEVLTRTLQRAGELAVPDGSHVPFQIGAETSPESVQRARGSGLRPSRQLLKLAMTGIAAAVLIAVGLAVLVGSSSPTTIQRFRLSAVRGEQLLCGAPGCRPPVPTPAGSNSAASPASAIPSSGAVRSVPPPTPQDVWIVAANGRFVEAFPGSAVGNRRSGPGSVYLSAGAGRYYRFVTGQTGGPLRLVHHSPHSVTLRGTDGRRYVLNLQSAELDTPR
jgi:hypothetical protein